MTDIKSLMCNWLRCADECQEQLVDCHEANVALDDALTEAQETIRQLELLSPHPKPSPIEVVYQKDSAWVNQMLAPLNVHRMPLDANFWLCSTKDFMKIIAWDWIDSIDYWRERFDCEDFAALFKAHVALYFGLNNVAQVVDYDMGHSYNLILLGYPTDKVLLFEPQSDGIWLWDARPSNYNLQGSYVLI